MIGSVQSEETKLKKLISMKKTMAVKFPIEKRNNFDRSKAGSEEHKIKMSIGLKKYYENMSDEKRTLKGNNISKGLKGKQSRLGQKNSKEHNEKILKTRKMNYEKRFHEYALSMKDFIISTEHMKCTEIQKEYSINRQLITRLRKYIKIN
jgi:hypothetical protein